MPRVTARTIGPAEIEGFSGLNQSSLTHLRLAGILPARGRLTDVDAVVARLCRYLYPRGLETSCPCLPPEREPVRTAVAEVAQKVRGILGEEEVPLAIVVDLDEGQAIAAYSPGDWVNALVKRPGVCMLIRLEEWWQEVQGLLVGQSSVAEAADGLPEVATEEPAMVEPDLTYRVRWSAKDHAYVATTAEFPSLSWLADGRAEAVRGVRELVRDVLQDMAASDQGQLAENPERAPHP